MRKLCVFLTCLSMLALAGALPLESFPAPYVVYGEAAWYSSQSCKHEGTSGVWTASGERFRDSALTCALRQRNFGQYYRVTNLANGKSVVVKHNDFGPARRWRDPKSGKTHDLSRRVIDLSKGAFQKIADPRQGIIKRVRIEKVRR